MDGVWLCHIYKAPGMQCTVTPQALYLAWRALDGGNLMGNWRTLRCIHGGLWTHPAPAPSNPTNQEKKKLENVNGSISKMIKDERAGC